MFIHYSCIHYMQLFVETCEECYFSSSWSGECSKSRLSCTFWDVLLEFLYFDLRARESPISMLRLLVTLPIITEIIKHNHTII